MYFFHLTVCAPSLTWIHNQHTYAVVCATLRRHRHTPYFTFVFGSGDLIVVNHQTVITSSACCFLLWSAAIFATLYAVATARDNSLDFRCKKFNCKKEMEKQEVSQQNRLRTKKNRERLRPQPDRVKAGKGTTHDCGCFLKGRKAKRDRGLLMEKPRHAISRLLIGLTFPGPGALPLPLADSELCLWRVCSCWGRISDLCFYVDSPWSSSLRRDALCASQS